MKIRQPFFYAIFLLLASSGFASDHNKRDIIIQTLLPLPEDIDAALKLPCAEKYSKRTFDPFPMMKVDRVFIENFISLIKSDPPYQPTLKLHGNFLFIDEDNRRHIDMVLAHDEKKFTVVVVRGGDISKHREIMTDSGYFAISMVGSRVVYYDVYGTLLQQVGVEKLPSRVTQVGNRILIEEIPIRGKLPHELIKRDTIIQTMLPLPEDIDAALKLPCAEKYSKRTFDPFPMMKFDRVFIESFISLIKSDPPYQWTLKLHRKFLFVDGDKQRHLNWALAHDMNKFTIVVVRGEDVLTLREEMKDSIGYYSTNTTGSTAVYFDVYGTLFQQVGVEKLPSRVTQVGNRILIEEIPIRGKLPHELIKRGQ
ncbi:MAG: hypothetical protein K1060chlam2_00582 [Chlamydiae bacterium]|nr:hypothetical protein [Chlamydiota bacterium]